MTKRSLPAGQTTWQSNPSWRPYVKAIVLVGAVSILCESISQFISPTNLAMPYLLAVVISAIRWGRGPSLLTALSGTIAFDFLFIPPKYSFAITDMQYVITLSSLLAVSLVTSTLTARMSEQTDAARYREAQTAALYNLTRDLAAAVGVDAILQALMRHTRQVFDREIAIFLSENGGFRPALLSSGFPLDESRSAAVWIFQHLQSNRKRPAILSNAEAHYLPMQTPQGVVGILAVRRKEEKDSLPQERQRLLEAFAGQAALAIERMRLAGEALQLAEANRTKSEFLSIASHEIRTPLNAILGYSALLRNSKTHPNAVKQQEMQERIYQNAKYLLDLTSQILDLGKIEAGQVKITSAAQEVSLSELMRQIMSNLGSLAEQKGLHLALIDDPTAPPIFFDSVKLSQIFMNLLSNAIKFTDGGTITVRIIHHPEEGKVSVILQDTGIGIPADQIPHLFEPFFQIGAEERPSSGTGLGLPIVKKVVDALGGTIDVESTLGVGSTFTVRLPYQLPS